MYLSAFDLFRIVQVVVVTVGPQRGVTFRP
jgi:hypothetical protein